MSTCPTCRKAFASAAFCPQDGTRLVDERDGSVVLDNRYRLIRQVGAGGMGEVYEAEHIHIHRKVAVKILKPEIASDVDAIARLKQEAQTTSGLGHPNIVDTLDFGHADGQSYLVMEWLEGENLDQRLARGAIDITTALEIAAQVAAGLGEAHARGVIHRDVKPANLFLTTDRNGALLVKIVDFGIAKLAANQVALTATGVLIGSPSYMAPEQAMGEPVDARTDVYALGVILYEMVTGSPPFRGDTPLAVLHQHTSKAPVPPSESAADRGISTDVEGLILRCLAKRPDERFTSMKDFVRALDEIRGLGSVRTPAHAPDRSAPTIVPSSRASQAMPHVLQLPIEHVQVSAGDDIDSPPATATGRRTRWIVAVGVLALAGGVVGFLAIRDNSEVAVDAGVAIAADAGLTRGDGSTIGVDAMLATDATLAPTPDASSVAIADASLDAPVAPAWRQQGRGRQFAFVATSPDLPRQGKSFEVTIVFDELSGAAASSIRARLTLEFFRDHAVVHASTHPLGSAHRFATTISGAREGKHHVQLELLDGEQRIDIARFDLIVAP